MRFEKKLLFFLKTTQNQRNFTEIQPILPCTTKNSDPCTLAWPINIGPPPPLPPALPASGAFFTEPSAARAMRVRIECLTMFSFKILKNGPSTPRKSNYL